MIQAGDSLKLIDLGGVRRADDDQSAIYGTVGYQAPEVADVGPSVASDIFTIGRTLAVLAMEFRGYQSTYVATLPPVDDTPLFQRYDSLYRVLAKATATNPDDRFQSADELRDQLLGVLREVVAVDSGTPRPRTRPRRRCSARRPAPARSSTWADLPALRVDRSDSVGDLAGRRVARRRRPAAARCSSRRPSRRVEVQLAKARAAIDAGVVRRSPTQVRRTDCSPTTRGSGGRCGCRGSPRCAQADFERRATAFNTVLGQVPGELAPKLALALACEQTGDADLAEQLYAVCAATDANYVAPAAFGLARTARARRRRARRARGPRPRRADQRRVRRGPPAPRRAAHRGRARASTSSPPRPPASTNIAIDPRDRLTLAGADPRRRASTRWSATATSRRRTIGRAVATEPTCAPRPSRRTASWRRSPPTAPSASASSTPPTPCDPGRSCDRSPAA